MNKKPLKAHQNNEKQPKIGVYSIKSYTNRHIKKHRKGFPAVFFISILMLIKRNIAPVQ
jgi:hypothetical protein